MKKNLKFIIILIIGLIVGVLLGFLIFKKDGVFEESLPKPK